jgi:hypothetical protein
MANVTLDWVAYDNQMLDRLKDNMAGSECPLRQVTAQPCRTIYDMHTDTFSNCGCPRCLAHAEGHKFDDCPICEPKASAGPA